MQPEFDLKLLKQLIVFPTHHEREACQVGYDGSGAILAIQPQQRPFLRKLLRLQIGLKSCHCATQFCPVLAEALVAKGFKFANAEITMIPQTLVELTGKQAESMLKMMDKLEDCDDVQNVYANFDISADEMEKMM